MTAHDAWHATTRNIAAVCLHRAGTAPEVDLADLAPSPELDFVRVLADRHRQGLPTDVAGLIASPPKGITADFVRDLRDELALAAGLPGYLREARRLAADYALSVESVREGGARPEHLRRIADRLATDGQPDEPETLTFDAVREEKVSWLVDGLLPRKAFTLLVGAGGLGKTSWAATVIAAYTRGRDLYPGVRTGGPGHALIVSAEDAIASVLVPRVRLAGADLSRVHAINPSARDLVLPDDVDWLAALIERMGIGLVFLDPVTAFLSGTIQSNNAVSLRSALRPLHAMAERLNLAIFGVSHVNKASGGDVADRTTGSRAWIDASRSALAFGRKPGSDDTDPCRVLVVAKGNYAPTAIAFELTLRVPTGEQHPVVSYVGQSDASTFEVLATQSGEHRSMVEDAVEFLDDTLCDGGWHPSSEIKERCEAEGLTAKSIRTARERLGVEVDRQGNRDQHVTLWRLPSPVVPSTRALPLSPQGHEWESQQANSIPLPLVPTRALSETVGTSNPPTDNPADTLDRFDRGEVL